MRNTSTHGTTIHKEVQFLLASMCASLSSSARSCPRLPVDTGQVSAPQSFCKMNRNVLQLEGKKRRNKQKRRAGGGDGSEGETAWELLQE